MSSATQPANSSTSREEKKPDAFKIPKSFDSYSVYTMLRDFVADETSPNPIRIPIDDPFVRHFIHQAALRMDLVSASEGGFTHAPGASVPALKGGPVREVVIWKGRQKELQDLRKLIMEFATNPSKGERIELPPMAPNLRYASRLICRDYGLVGLSEGLGSQRHCVLWRTQDKQQIDEKLRQFAASNTGEKLEFPPMDASMRRFTAIIASDLGLYPMSQGYGEDKHTIVYRMEPPSVAHSADYFTSLFSSSGITADRVNVNDIRGALKAAGLPEALGRAAIEMAEASPTGTVSINSLCKMVAAKEKELRSVFNAFDKDHDGQICIDEIEKALSAIDIAPTSADHQLMEVLIDQAKKKGEAGLSFTEFKNICSLLDLDDLSRLRTDRMVISSLGFQSATKDKTHASIYTTIASALSGGIANAFSRTCVAPFERVRLQMSVDSNKYKGMSDCMRTVYRNEGIKGLWRGNVLNVIRIAPQGAISFFAKDFVRDLMPDTLKYSSTGLALASMMSGAICMSAVYPLDFVRGRMTTCPGLYTSWQSALVQIYKQGGMKALFEGVNHSNVWAAAYYGVQFYSYDMMKKTYVDMMKANGKEAKINPTTGLAFGAVSGTFCVSAAYPFELIRRKLQVQGVAGRPVLYKGWFDCFNQVWKAEGFKGMFKGLGANMFKTPPSIAITFGTYEFLMKSVFNTDAKA